MLAPIHIIININYKQTPLQEILLIGKVLNNQPEV